MIVVHEKHEDEENIREDEAGKCFDNHGKIVKYKM